VMDYKNFREESSNFIKEVRRNLGCFSKLLIVSVIFDYIE
jgi:hypothetical protein